MEFAGLKPNRKPTELDVRDDLGHLRAIWGSTLPTDGFSTVIRLAICSGSNEAAAISEMVYPKPNGAGGRAVSGSEWTVLGTMGNVLRKTRLGHQERGNLSFFTVFGHRHQIIY